MTKFGPKKLNLKNRTKKRKFETVNLFAVNFNFSFFGGEFLHNSILILLKSSLNHVFFTQYDLFQQEKNFPSHKCYFFKKFYIQMIYVYNSSELMKMPFLSIFLDILRQIRKTLFNVDVEKSLDPNMHGTKKAIVAFQCNSWQKFFIKESLKVFIHGSFISMF